MQLVLSNNRVLTYGENFIALGGIVINTETGRKYENATIAECDCIPSDIDDVGYEYRSGDFVPCAPFGKGSGNVAVLCSRDCKSIKDSGIPFSQVGEIIEFTYTGDNMSSGITLPILFHKKPKILFISGNDATGIVLSTPGVGFSIKNNCIINILGGPQTIITTNPLSVNITESDAGFDVKLIDTSITMNTSNQTYNVTAIC